MQISSSLGVRLPWLMVVLVGGVVTAQDKPEDWFTSQVRPILQSRCGKCHGPDVSKPKGGLRMTDRAAMLAGGESGPAIAPGDPDGSLMIRAVRYGNPEFEMPPAEKLPEDEIATLVEWVRRGAPWATPTVDPREAQFFERKIRPLLSDRCFRCHGPDVEEVESGLRMAGRPGLLAGGNRGPALVPGSPHESRMVQAVSYRDRDLKMPPDGRLPDHEISLLARWIKMGAPWPNYVGPGLERATEDGYDFQEGRQWWSFLPLVRPEVPDIGDPARARRPLDTFILARLDAAGLAPSPAATDRELVRRLHMDVLGLPPIYEEVEAYLSDTRLDRWERLVDEVLARPAYGERLGRLWLDVVRYAQTNGYERDTEKPFAWRYRDWVIEALNEDMPYDRFLLEQLAGDELADADADAVVATGFYRLGNWDDEPDDRKQAEFDELDDTLRTIGEGMLGVTLGCARCHDHKFDPFPQEDYYSILAFIRSVRRYEKPQYSLDSAILTPLVSAPEDLVQWARDRAARGPVLQKGIEEWYEAAGERHRQQRIREADSNVQVAVATPASRRTPEQVGLVVEFESVRSTRDDIRNGADIRQRKKLAALTNEAKALEVSFQGTLDWTLAVSERGSEPVATQLLLRGRASTPGADVPARFVRVLCPTDESVQLGAAVPPADGQTTGLRRQLADWIASPVNPLTARVIVNRVWAGLFGRGIVPTPNDFGRAGMPPTHPILLDWLASELIEEGWSLKALHRQILLSAAYRRSSHAENQVALDADPDNHLLWRRNLRRLPAEAVRDSILFVSGELKTEPAGGPSYFPHLSREALAGMSRPGQGWGVSNTEDRARRGVYTYVKRGVLSPLLAVFDFPNTSLPIGHRPTTTTAPQALVLLNNDFVNEQAKLLAARVRRESGGGALADLVRRAYELVLTRPPRPEEMQVCTSYLREQTAAFGAADSPLVVRPAVPGRLDFNYLDQLGSDDFLYGPREGWLALKGEWGNVYNLTLRADPDRGPALLNPDARHSVARFHARVMAGVGCTLAGFVLRGGTAGDVLTGLEIRMEPATGQVAALLHTRASTERLAEASAGIETDRWHDLVITLYKGRVLVQIDGAEALTLDLSDVDLPDVGGFGLRVTGDAVVIDGAVLRTPNGDISLAGDAPAEPGRRALESLCLALLNANEFVYVD